jgi:hypothetical protein
MRWLNVVALVMLASCSGASKAPGSSPPVQRPDALQLSYSKRLQGWERVDGPIRLTKPPQDAVRVTVKVIDVNLPTINSPSILGERATVTFSLSPGSIASHPTCQLIRMKFDPYANPFREGDAHVLLFLPDGSFWGGETFSF